MIARQQQGKFRNIGAHFPVLNWFNANIIKELFVEINRVHDLGQMIVWVAETEFYTGFTDVIDVECRQWGSYRHTCKCADDSR